MAAIDLYPLVSQGGQAIPLEIVKPISMMQWTMMAGAAQEITIPAEAKTAWFYSSVNCVICFGSGAGVPSTLIDDTEYPNAIFIPAGHPINIEVTPGVATLLGFTSGVAFMNFMVQWAALSQARQTTVG
jgi:hypothetical protein